MNRLRLAAVMLTALLFGGSCSEETVIRPVRDGVGGTVAGRVRMAGDGAPAWIRVESVEGDADQFSWFPETWFEGQTLKDGTFQMQIPPGEYFLRVIAKRPQGNFDIGVSSGTYWSRGGIVPSWSLGDTLALHAGTSLDSLDVQFGRLAIRLNLPPEWVGGRLRLYLEYGSWPLDLGTVGAWVRSEVMTPNMGVVFEGLVGGEYRARLDVDYVDPVTEHVQELQLWLPSALVREDAEPILVHTEQASTHEFTVTPERFTIRGAVDGAWLSLSSGAPTVSFFTADSVEIGNAPCDSIGNFEASYWARVPVKLGILRGHNQSWFGGMRFDDATLFEPPSDGELSGLRFTDSAIDVRIHVPDEFLTRGIGLDLVDPAGARVASIFAPDSPGDPAVISFLHPGSYRLRVRPLQFLRSDWAEQWYDRARDLTGATPIEVVREGEIVTVDVTLEAGAQIRGVVRDLTGSQIPRFGLYLTRIDSGAIIGSAPAGDDQGNYILRGISPGAYRLAAHRTWDLGFVTATDLPADARWYRNRINWADADLITITGVDTVNGVDFTLP